MNSVSGKAARCSRSRRLFSEFQLFVCFLGYVFKHDGKVLPAPREQIWEMRTCQKLIDDRTIVKQRGRNQPPSYLLRLSIDRLAFVVFKNAKRKRKSRTLDYSSFYVFILIFGQAEAARVSKFFTNARKYVISDLAR